MKRDSKTKYYEEFFERNKMKTAEIWKGIKSIVNMKSANTSSYKLLDSSNNLISNHKLMANIL